MVIDASVARSCNDPTENEDAAACFLFLSELSKRDRDTGVIVNDELDREWEVHASGAFVRWLARMETRKRVVRVPVKRLADYRKVVAGVSDTGIRVALEKDAHLVELSLIGQNPVVSRDDRQQRYVRDLAVDYPLVGSIQWINPVNHGDWRSWFDRGCDRHSFALAT
ncbi:hypothetical protein [Curtobacterium sp. 1310]|uniref:hypothetical protein n=1 Tax=Curtobacterium sp. 1310 TaxID=2806570 RepID=UPI001AE67A72|nr:hypothetical protein [Curtobacterium sp. 1310]MBP1301689.1 hypothetical protein [Curtobacterium sp. 1310]